MTAPQASKATNGSKTAFLGSKGPQTPGHDVTSGELPGILGRSRPNFLVPPLVARSSQAGARELPHILSHAQEHPTSQDSPTWLGPIGPIIQTGAFGPFGGVGDPQEVVLKSEISVYSNMKCQITRFHFPVPPTVTLQPHNVRGVMRDHKFQFNNSTIRQSQNLA
ncbi:hypothetical protein C8J57DRAFT_1238960 [Mycena rebaudengoi]|nr:hypothetical protein C8J57DRAFT_1238960 [Mycena rebaudengoi]